MPRPVLMVLAGVNGAGKSSIGGHLLRRAGVEWFNPDDFARDLMGSGTLNQQEANAMAWREGLQRLDDALARGESHAFETTLGGRTLVARIRDAARTHDVLIWFCGLATVEQYIARVRLRVAHGGHAIPEDKIRERYPAALANLIGLMPCLTHLRVYDNSTEVALGAAVPDPVLVLEVVGGSVAYPVMDRTTLQKTPEWAKPVVEAAFSLFT